MFNVYAAIIKPLCERICNDLLAILKIRYCCLCSENCVIKSFDDPRKRVYQWQAYSFELIDLCSRHCKGISIACHCLQLCIGIYVFLVSLTDRSFLVANALAETHHIIFCSDGFCKMTGYTRAEVMQRSAATDFLHGPMTSQSTIEAVKEALIRGFEKHFEILYYRKNGKWILMTVWVFHQAFC